MATIEIDKTIVEQTTIMLPAFYDIIYFLQRHAALYQAFEHYRGSVKSEVEAFSQENLKQINILAAGYDVLVKDLEKIVEAFVVLDDKINEYNKEITENMSADVKNSLGI